MHSNGPKAAMYIRLQIQIIVNRASAEDGTGYWRWPQKVLQSVVAGGPVFSVQHANSTHTPLILPVRLTFGRFHYR